MSMTTKRLLIVDDEPNVTLTLSESLQALGNEYLVEVVNTPSAALELIRKTNYDIILTDYKMPGITGIELASEANKLSPTTQVILMTAYSNQNLRSSLNETSLSGFIEKPFSIKQIREVILQAIEKTSPTALDPFRHGEKRAPDGLRLELGQLQKNTGARAVMLISTSGFPVETSGQTSGLDLTSVGALVAANFVAATELARLLGNNSIFKTSYHEGDDFNIYAYALDRDFLLTVVFGQETKPGTIWFYTKQSANTLNTILRNMPPLEPLPMSGLDSLDLALDDLFGEDSNARTAFLNYEDAIQQGILPNLKPKNQNEGS